MKKENIIDLIAYRDPSVTEDETVETGISDELKTAIQNLIHRLRELGPIPQSS